MPPRIIAAAVIVLITLAATPTAALDCFDHDDVLRQLGETAIDQDLPRELCVVGDAAYSLGLGDPFVAIYDLSDPAEPQERDPLPLPAEPTGIAASDDWLLVAVPGLGLVRYDLSAPLAPAVDDTLDLGLELNDVALRDGLAAVSTIEGVRVIGLDFAIGMVALGSHDTPSTLASLAVDGTRLYLATSDHGLLVLDASDPTWLQPVGVADFVGEPEEVSARDGLAVVTGRYTDGTRGQVSAYDIASDGPPLLRASTFFDHGLHGRAIPRVVGPDRVIITSAGTGVHSYLVADQQVERTGFLPGSHADFHLGGNRYTMLSESRLQSGEPGPLPAPPLEVAGAGEIAVVHDDHIVSVHDGILTVVQVDAPSGAVPIGSLDIGAPNMTRPSLAMLDPAVYVGNTAASIDVIDLTDRNHPQPVSTISLQAIPTGMVVADQVLVVLMRDWGLATYGLADPLQPQHIATFAADIGADRGAVALGDQVLVGTSGGVDVYDVSDPAAIVLADNLPDRDSITGLALAGDRLLVTDRIRSTQVWKHDADPGDWTLQGSIPLSGQLSVAVGGAAGYLLDGTGEVAMLDLREEGVPPIVATLPTRFVADTYLLADDDWLGVPRGTDHRFYPPPCLLDPTPVEPAPPPSGLALEAAPNPFNPRTRISFDLRRSTDVTLRIFDLRGRRVATLLAAPLPAGRHEIDWRGIGTDGRPLPSGVYHARLTAAGSAATRELTLLK
ncbi:hypothetical protein GF314_13075 [bacterium]|nr:hypothetical protein [bacterium]